MSWRRFTALVAGLSKESMWMLSQRNAPAGGDRPSRQLNPAETGSYLRSLCTRKRGAA